MPLIPVAVTMIGSAVILFVWVFIGDAKKGEVLADSSMHTLIGLAAFFLLSFRANASYDRWYEGRKQWGMVINRTRDLARQFTQIVPNDAVEGGVWRRALGHIVAFAVTMKRHLRDERGLMELRDVLSQNDVDAILASAHMPLHAIDVLGSYIEQARRREDQRHPVADSARQPHRLRGLPRRVGAHQEDADAVRFRRAPPLGARAVDDDAPARALDAAPLVRAHRDARRLAAHPRRRADVDRDRESPSATTPATCPGRGAIWRRRQGQHRRRPARRRRHACSPRAMREVKSRARRGDGTSGRAALGLAGSYLEGRRINCSKMAHETAALT